MSVGTRRWTSIPSTQPRLRLASTSAVPSIDALVGRSCSSVWDLIMWVIGHQPVLGVITGGGG